MCVNGVCMNVCVEKKKEGVERLTKSLLNGDEGNN